ncbi:MAG: phosphodiester glycosidase family protein [Prevotella sp.]|nr:phosphodiester glycosidase family protein [Staphylococcus sp.]MCM1350646.1 phosphodiester glycosidase family protein [Prevotella sp.]
MIKKRYIKICIGIMLVVFLFAFGNVKVYAQGEMIQKDQQITQEGMLSDDTSYHTYTASLTNESGITTKQNISYIRSSLNQAKVVTSCVLNQNGIVASDIITIAKDYEEKHPGYEVLAALNGGYFFTGSRYETVNASVIEGNVIKANNHTKYFSLGFHSDGSNYVNSIVNQQASQYDLTIYDSTTFVPIKEIQLNGENTTPQKEQTTFFSNYTTASITSGVTYFEVDTMHHFSYGSTYLYGTVLDSTTKVSNQPMIATTSEEIIQLLQNHPVIRIEKKLIGALKGYENVIGPGSQTLLDGHIQSIADMKDQNESFCKGRDPRSSIGFDQNGNIILCAIDGRQSNMAGVSLTEEAYIMKELGCVDAYNLDGGGSTELAIKVDGEFQLLNQPCEKPYRKITDAVLIVVPKVKVEMTSPTITSTSIQFRYQVAPSHLNPQIDIYVNGEKKDAEGWVDIGDLNPDTSNFISVVARYEEEGQIIQSIIRTFQVNDTKAADKVTWIEPHHFQVNFEKTSQGFDAILSCDDPSGVLSKVYLVDQNGNQQILIKRGETYQTSYHVSQNETYTFSILYYYKVSSIQVKSKTDNQTFSYTYQPVSQVEEQPKKGCHKGASFIFPLCILPIVAVALKRKKD